MQDIIRDIQDALKRLEGSELKGSLTDFKQQRRESARLMLRGAIQRLKKASVSYPETIGIVSKIEHADFSELQPLLEQLADIVVENPASTRQSFTLPRVPSDIQSEVHADISELESCLNAKCYRSAIILCGRLLETVLHRKYFDATGHDLLEKAPGMGLGNLIARLNDKGVKLDPGLPNQIHLINQMRIVSVHKKKDLFIPSESQTRAIVLYTLDVVERLFK